MSGFFAGRNFSDEAKPFQQKSATAAAMIYKTFDSPVTKVVDDKQGVVEALVNSTGVKDLQNDVMEKGCWTDVINKMHTRQTSWPSILFGHEWQQPVGRVESAWETESGLWIRGRFNLATTRGHDAYEDVKFGSIKQWSVGFMPADDGHATDGYGVHHITKVGAWPEVSCVLVGASPGTRTTTIKSANPNDAFIAPHLRRYVTGRGLPDYLTAKARPSWSREDYSGVDVNRVMQLVLERLGKAQPDTGTDVGLPERYVDPDAPKPPHNVTRELLRVDDAFDVGVDPDSIEAFTARLVAGLPRPDKH